MWLTNAPNLRWPAGDAATVGSGAGGRFRCGDGERRCGSAYSPLAAARSAVGTGVGGGSAELRGSGELAAAELRRKHDG